MDPEINNTISYLWIVLRCCKERHIKNPDVLCLQHNYTVKRITTISHNDRAVAYRRSEISGEHDSVETNRF